MPRKSCSKCGAKVRSRYPTFEATLVQEGEEPDALVQFRHFVSITINGTPTNFSPSQIVRLKYSIITLLLNTPELETCLYFKKQTDKFEYLIAHPEHKDKDI